MVVFLDVSITDAAKRVGFNRDRPLLLGSLGRSGSSSWSNVARCMRPVATHTVSTDGIEPAAVVDRILEVLDVM